MCYLGGSKLSKKSTFKFVPIRNGIEGLAATCDVCFKTEKKKKRIIKTLLERYLHRYMYIYFHIMFLDKYGTHATIKKILKPME